MIETSFGNAVAETPHDRSDTQKKARAHAPKVKPIIQRGADLLSAFLAWTGIATVTLGGSIACGSSAAGCPEFCRRQIDCCPAGSFCAADQPDVTSCVSTCQALAKKDATFEAAMSTEADCMEQKSCPEILSGVCIAHP